MKRGGATFEERGSDAPQGDGANRITRKRRTPTGFNPSPRVCACVNHDYIYTITTANLLFPTLASEQEGVTAGICLDAKLATIAYSSTLSLKVISFNSHLGFSRSSTTTMVCTIFTIVTF